MFVCGRCIGFADLAQVSGYIMPGLSDLVGSFKRTVMANLLYVFIYLRVSS